MNSPFDEKKINKFVITHLINIINIQSHRVPKKAKNKINDILL